MWLQTQCIMRDAWVAKELMPSSRACWATHLIDNRRLSDKRGCGPVQHSQTGLGTRKNTSMGWNTRPRLSCVMSHCYIPFLPEGIVAEFGHMHSVGRACTVCRTQIDIVAAILKTCACTLACLRTGRAAMGSPVRPAYPVRRADRAGGRVS